VLTPPKFSSMHYVYILKSQKDGKLYIGYTNDLQNQFKKHNQGKSFATKTRDPFGLIYYETYLAKADAKKREQFFKIGWGRNYIKRNLKNTLLILKLGRG